jgi:hypothetical protein
MKVIATRQQAKRARRWPCSSNGNSMHQFPVHPCWRQRLRAQGILGRAAPFPDANA